MVYEAKELLTSVIQRSVIFALEGSIVTLMDKIQFKKTVNAMPINNSRTVVPKYFGPDTPHPCPSQLSTSLTD